MKFTYIGDAKDGKTSFRGITFEHGRPVEVTDPEAIKKLETNTYFVREAAGAEKPPAPTKTQPTSKPAISNSPKSQAQVAKSDDDDGDLV